jgi:hypothetical protein
MAVTNETSAEYKDVTDPRTNGGVSSLYFRDIQYVPFNFVQGAAAGDDGSTATLLYLQKGRYVILPKLSFIQWSALGASRVTDIGFSAHTDEAGAAVAAALTRMDENVDMSSAGSAAMGSDLAIADAAGIYLNIGGTSNTDGVSIVASVTGGTIPAAAVLRGYLAVAKIA